MSKNESYPGIFIGPVCIAIGVYFLYGAWHAFADAKWPAFMPPQLDGIALVAGLFSPRVGAYIAGAIASAITALSWFIALAIMLNHIRGESHSPHQAINPAVPAFIEYELVRVRQLIQSADALDGWGLNQRPPAPGEIGTLLGVLTTPGVPNKYVVECSGADGITIWLSDFYVEEIEPV